MQDAQLVVIFRTYVGGRVCTSCVPEFPGLRDKTSEDCCCPYSLLAYRGSLPRCTAYHSFRCTSKARRRMVSVGSKCRQNIHAVHVPALRGRAALPVPRRRLYTARLHVRAESDKPETSSGSNDADSDKGGLKMPSFLKPLTDFGVGKKSVWEGGVGLFILTGIGTTQGLQL